MSSKIPSPLHDPHAEAVLARLQAIGDRELKYLIMHRLTSMIGCRSASNESSLRRRRRLNEHPSNSYTNLERPDHNRGSQRDRASLGLIG